MNLRRNISPTGSNASSGAGAISPFARTNAMINNSTSELHSPTTTTTPGNREKHARNISSPRVRFLPRGQIFEASHRMEITGDSSLYTNGKGLIKLADGSGWAIVPHGEDLMAQFKRFYHRDSGGGDGGDGGGNASMLEKLENGRELAAYEEIGNATIPLVGSNSAPGAAAEWLSSPQKLDGDNGKNSNDNVVWLRVVNPSNGIKVLLPPQQKQPTSNQQPREPSHNNNTTPPPKQQTNLNQGINQSVSHNDSSFSEVGTSSVVSSSFFDSVWNRVTTTNGTNTNATSTPTKEAQGQQQQKATAMKNGGITSPKQRQQQPQQQATMLPVIPCGLVVPVEKWESSTSSKSFVRLYNSQGWIPRRLGDTTYAQQLSQPPQIRVGSFWFRVTSAAGLHVRHGPSIAAPVIRSKVNNYEDGVSFRFECGEYLRASEIVTTVVCRNENGSSGGTTGTLEECFAKLYRRRNNADSISGGRNTSSSSSSLLLNRYSSLQSLTSPGEWVQVHANRIDNNDHNDNAKQEPLLEECSAPPIIERNRDGWRYTALCNSNGDDDDVTQALSVRCGPSLRSNVVPGAILRRGEQFLVSEKVTAAQAAGSNSNGREKGATPTMTWLRLKSGRGWVPAVGEDGRAAVIESTSAVVAGMEMSHYSNIDRNNGTSNNINGGVRDNPNNDAEHSHRMVRQILEKKGSSSHHHHHHRAAY